MIILIHGKDQYRSLKRLKEIISCHQDEKTVLPVRIFESNNTDLSELKDELRKVSIFKGKQLIVLKGAFSNSSKIEILKQRQIIDIPDTIVFFEKEAVNKTDPLYLMIKKTGEVEQFDPLNDRELAVWIKNRLKVKSTVISESALRLLICSVGNDLWKMANEVDKLASYVLNSRIEEADTKELINNESESVIFNTIDQIASRNAKTAFPSIHRHLEGGESPFYILSMIAFQFRNLLIIKAMTDEGQPYHSFNKTSGIHPYVIKKSIVLAQKFTLEELKKIYRKIFKADLEIKKGKIEAVTAIDLLVGDICLSKR